MPKLRKPANESAYDRATREEREDSRRGRCADARLARALRENYARTDGPMARILAAVRR